MTAAAGPSLDCYIDASTLRPGGLSIRLNPGDRTSTKFVEALKAAGFQAGDLVTLTRNATPPSSNASGTTGAGKP